MYGYCFGGSNSASDFLSALPPCHEGFFRAIFHRDYSLSNGNVEEDLELHDTITD